MQFKGWDVSIILNSIFEIKLCTLQPYGLNKRSEFHSKNRIKYNWHNWNSFFFVGYRNDRLFSHSNPYISNVTQQLMRCSPMLIFRAWATCEITSKKSSMIPITSACYSTRCNALAPTLKLRFSLFKTLILFYKAMAITFEGFWQRKSDLFQLTPCHPSLDVMVIK